MQTTRHLAYIAMYHFVKTNRVGGELCDDEQWCTYLRMVN